MADNLNPPQLDAVRTLRGPLLVLAGAGTGKTRVVTYRIAELIRRGTPAERILAVTFTNKAATEMQQRMATLLGKRLEKPPEISTFHSLCVRVLRRQIHALGYPPAFAIYDRGDQESIARAALREIKVPAESLRPSELLYFISRWKSSSVRPSQATEAAATDKEHLAAAGYRRYQKALKAAGAVDFDDLLVLTEELFEHFPDVRKAEAARFHHVLIDEYQDTNGSQYRIVKALVAGHRNLCVVGDDDQSIYGWRGAEVAHILRFKRDWPDAKVVRLEDNYRSTAEILDLANRLIAHNRQRHEKVLRPARSGGPPPRILQCEDEQAEAKQVVADIQTRLTQKGMQPRDFAILTRTNEQCRAFEMELRRAGVPYIVLGGMSFYDRKEVRDILSYLKLLVSPTDEIALLRIINRPARGIGQATVTSLVEHAVRAGQPVWELLSSEQRPPEVRINAATGEAIRKFQALVLRFQQRAAREPVVDVVRDLIRDIGYRDEIERAYENPAEQLSRWSAVEEVVNAVGRYQQRATKPTLREFLDEAQLEDRDDDDKESQLAKNAVALMTLHSAKGLEFPEVYLVGMEEGFLPHHRADKEGLTAVEEERRLCYVGVTRAQERLTMSLSLSRMKWGKSRSTEPSRFLYELTGKERPNKKSVGSHQRPAGGGHGKNSRGGKTAELPSGNVKKTPNLPNPNRDSQRR
jgi:DNA helicase-2/ATP-dependent DNA helicase PcrA